MPMYNKRFSLFSVALITLALAAFAIAQDKSKRPSPPAKAETTINGQKVTIDYSQPSKKGREIFGELVPYGQVWRTGANEATSLTTGTDLVIGGTNVPAGKYTVYTVPQTDKWWLVINKQTGQWGTTYDQSQDLARIEMKVAKLDAPVEKFTISFPDGNKLAIDWDATRAWVDVKGK
jgi:Protein of unknown function (DUF2911)